MANRGIEGVRVGRRQLIKTGLVASVGTSAAAWALSACGPAKPAPSNAKIVLQWAPWNVGWKSSYNSIFYEYTKAFREQNPGVDISVMTPPGDGPIEAGIEAGGGSTVPDVFGSYGAASYIEGNLVLDLAPYIKEYNVDLSQFQASQMGFVTPPGGHIYGLPAEISTNAILVSLDAVNTAGVTAP